MDIKRGDIFYVYPSGVNYGSEIRSGRPAVIVSNNEANKYSEVLEVVYMTTKEKKELPTHVQLTSSPQLSIALCEQITSVAKERLGDYYGTCTKYEMYQISQAMLVSLGMESHITKEKPEEETQEAEETPAPNAEMEEMARKITNLEAENKVYKELNDKLLNMMVGRT